MYWYIIGYVFRWSFKMFLLYSTGHLKRTSSVLRSSSWGPDLHQHRAWWCCTLRLICKATLIHNESIFLAKRPSVPEDMVFFPTYPKPPQFFWKATKKSQMHPPQKISEKNFLNYEWWPLKIHGVFIYIHLKSTRHKASLQRCDPSTSLRAPHPPEAQQRGPRWPQPKAIRGASKEAAGLATTFHANAHLSKE